MCIQRNTGVQSGGFLLYPPCENLVTMTSVTRRGEEREVRSGLDATAHDQPGNSGSTTAWPELIEVARAYRIATEYHDWQGKRVEVSAETLTAVLSGFGVQATTPA